MKTTKDDIFKAVESNHIWLNAFRCINPTPDYMQEVGRLIISMLNNKENLLSMYLDDAPESGTVSEDLAELTPVLYLSINKS